MPRSREEDFLIINFALAKEPQACPRGHKIYNFGKPFIGHQYHTFSLSEPCPRLEMMIFKEIHQFYTLGWGVGGIKFQFLVSSIYRCYITYLVKIGPVVLEKKILT